MDLKLFGEQLATALGSSWVYAHEDDYGTLRNKVEDAQFGIEFYFSNKRLIVRCLNARLKVDHCSKYAGDGITVNPDRGAAAIAKDIERRLLPEYRQTFANSVVQRDEWNSYLEKASSNLQMFAGILEGEVKGDEVRGGHRAGDDLGYIRRFQVGNTVHLEIGSLPIKAAAKLMEVWMAMGEEMKD